MIILIAEHVMHVWDAAREIRVRKLRGKNQMAAYVINWIPKSDESAEFFDRNSLCKK